MVKCILVLLFFLAFRVTIAKDTFKAGSLSKNTNNNAASKQMEELKIVKSNIVRLLKQVESKDWQTFHLIIEAPPFTNKGFNSTPTFLDSADNMLQGLWKEDWDYSQKVLDLIFQMNQKEMRNQIIFFTKRDDYDNAIIFTSFSQGIEDAFQSRLPKSKQGKTIPWFNVTN
jgi:hypothetical protein